MGMNGNQPRRRQRTSLATAVQSSSSSGKRIRKAERDVHILIGVGELAEQALRSAAKQLQRRLLVSVAGSSHLPMLFLLAFQGLCHRYSMVWPR